MTGVLDDGDDVGTVGSHVDQITARTVGELDGENGALGANDISNVRDGGTGSSTQVQDLGAGLHVDGVNTTKDTGSQLGLQAVSHASEHPLEGVSYAEGVPHAVLGGGGRTALLGSGRGHRDALLAVDGLAGGQVLGDEEILLAAAGDEDTGVPVGLDNDLAVEHC